MTFYWSYKEDVDKFLEITDTLRSVLGEDASDFDLYNSTGAVVKDFERLKKLVKKLEMDFDFFTLDKVLDLQSRVEKENEVISAEPIKFEKVDVHKDESKAD